MPVLTENPPPDLRVRLRPYQEDTHTSIAEAEARGVRNGLIVAATGLGKTVMFTALAQRRGRRSLIIAHRDELLTQAAAKVLEVWPDLGCTEAVWMALRQDDDHAALLRATHLNPAGVGLIKAGANDVHAQVVIASVQTLARPARLAKLTGAYDGSALLTTTEPFDLVVVDEAHHATADSYRSVLRGLHAGEPDGPLLLGVTATPDRGDGLGLHVVFGEVLANLDILFGIREGYLADLRGLEVQLEQFNAGALKSTAGDYNAGQAGAMLSDAGAPELIVRAWQEHASDRVRSLAFAPTVAVAQEIADAFNAAGIPAGMVHGAMPQDERRAVLRASREGKLRVLSNCAVLTEGYDDPAIDCIILARPTKSRALYAQMIGRGTRRHPDKADCLVLDVVGASEDKSLVTLPSLFGLTKKRRRAMADGTGTALGEVTADVAEQVAQGKLRTEELDLFKRVRSEGIAWIAAHRDGETRRYVRPLGKDEPAVLLVQSPTDPESWLAGVHWPPTSEHPKGWKQVLIGDVTMETAQGVGEDFVRKHAAANGNAVLVESGAAWRSGQPSKKALAAAAKWRLTVDPEWSAGELADRLDAHIIRIKAKPRRPPKETRA